MSGASIGADADHAEKSPRTSRVEKSKGKSAAITFGPDPDSRATYTASGVEKDQNIGSKHMNMMSKIETRGRSGVSVSANGNPLLWDAFEHFRVALTEMRSAQSERSRDDEDSFYRRMDCADEGIIEAPAWTPRDAALKLRRAFVGIVGERWSDLAIIDDKHLDFSTELHMSDMNLRMMWSAICDLEAMSESCAPVCARAERSPDNHDREGVDFG